MNIISTVPEMLSIAQELRLDAKKVGVVPTMGYLHEGHLSLIRIAKQHADTVITTLFVNPMQFGPNEDFSKYPRDLERDTRLSQSAGSDYLFIPPREEIYPSNYFTYVEVEQLTSVLEGKSRPTHFKGVTTIVAKLFNITKPHVAVFGQKDAQQVAVIQHMVKDLNYDIRIIIAPIIREPDGLAMSSRNVYLSPKERSESVVLSQSLRHAKELVSNGERHSSVIYSEMANLISSKPTASIDYISVADATTLQEISSLSPGTEVLISLAVRFGVTRLIDNIRLTI